MSLARKPVELPKPNLSPRPMDPARKYLTFRDIMNELQVSRARAFAIMHECTHLKDGRTIRVSVAAFDTWKRQREQAPTHERRYGEVARIDREFDACVASYATKPRRARQKPQSSSAETSSAELFSRPIVPRTKPRAKDSNDNPLLVPITTPSPKK